jgi:DNA polymerase elongation subunit (family B)
MLLNNSNKHFFSFNNAISEIIEEFQPYFLINYGALSDKAKNDLHKHAQQNRNITSLSKEIEYESFVNFTSDSREKLICKKVFCSHPGVVPTTSDELFQRYRKHGCEVYQFDIPYRTLVQLESTASGIPEKYMFNTDGKDEKIKVMSYDIENLRDGTICIIGYSTFDITINSFFDISTEESKFEIIDTPNWKDLEVKQLIAKPNKEHKILFEFIQLCMKVDIVSGHNILVYDNMELVNRVKYHKEANSYSQVELKIVNQFLSTYIQDINIFNYGKSDKGLLLYPNSLDTLLAMRRLYDRLPQYDLKSLAKEFNFIVEDRVYFTAEDFDKTTKDIFNNEELWNKFIKYNKHDVQEQNGLTILALQQILPLSFLTCLPLDEIVIKSNTKVGDAITISRCIHHKRIFPPMLNASKVSKKLVEMTDKYFIKDKDLLKIDASSKDLWKVAKYGNERPNFTRYPGLILNSETVGGLTLHPGDDEGSLPSADSNGVIWYNVIQPDVGFMYPALVLAKNACADTIRFADKNKDVDDHIWIKNLDNETEILNECPYKSRTPMEEYQDTGIEFGIIINKEIGMLAKALAGIIKLTTIIKQQKKVETDKDKKVAIKGLYTSLKAVRNSLTHGMVLAFVVSCRSSNLASGSLIVTYSNKIMFDIYKELKELE